MPKNMGELRLNQFKGCLIGVLVGDCLGKKFGNRRPNTIQSVEHKFRVLIDEENLSIHESERFEYTEITQMTIAVATFLAHGDLSDYSPLAQSYAKIMEMDGKSRKHSSCGIKLIQEWQQTNFENPCKASKELHHGQGSFGNGCGKKIAPAALYTVAFTSAKQLVEVTTKITELTHCHPVGVFGGLFQALAVRTAVIVGSSKTPHSDLDILDRFESDFTQVVKECKKNLHLKEGYHIYLEKLETMRRLLKKRFRDWTVAQVRTDLGNLFSAPLSVPTAFFCFLASFSAIPGIRAQNQFERGIILATSLGGDTSSIASMAAAICGAYTNLDGIPPNLYMSCEGYEGILELAEDVYGRARTNYINNIS